MRSVLAALAITLSVCASATAEDKGGTTDQERLQGLWRAVSIEHDGQPAPADVVKSFRILFKGEMMIADPESKQERTHAITLDSTVKPRAMDMTPAAGPGQGKKLEAAIYLLEGNKLTLCFDTATTGTIKRPNEFKTTPGDRRALIVLERVKPAK